MADIEPCTTWSVKRLHWSDCLSDLPGAYKGMVRRNVTLCGTAGVLTQPDVDRKRARQGRQPLAIADLPECKPCARAKEKSDG